MKQILLAGPFGRGNLGEDAILGAMLDDLRRCAPSARFRAIVGDAPGLPETSGIETVRWSDWTEVASAVRRADLVILGGGVLYEDPDSDPARLMRHPASDLGLATSIALLAKLYARPLMLYAVGLGPLLGDASRQAARLVLQLADAATIRDADSKTMATALGVDTSGIEETVNPALGMRIGSEESAREILRASGCDPLRPVIAVAPKPWPPFFSPADWAPTVAAALRAMMRNDGAQVLCLPFNPSEDDEWIDAFSAYFKQGELHRTPSLGAAEAAAVIGACDLVIGLRLHAMVFALRAGTAGLALTCEPKLRSFMEQAGQGAWCVETKNLAQFDGMLAAAWLQRRKTREEFARAGAALRAGAGRSAEVAAELIARPPAPASVSPALHDALQRLIEARLRYERVQEEYAEELKRRIEEQTEELSIRDQRIGELENLLSAKDAELRQIDNSFYGRLRGFFRRG